MECPNERMGNPNWRKGEKQLHSCTQWTYARFVTEKVRVHQLCAPFSTFNENVCHNLPWKEISPVLGPSFS